MYGKEGARNCGRIVRLDTDDVHGYVFHFDHLGKDTTGVKGPVSSCILLDQTPILLIWNNHKETTGIGQIL